MSKTIQEWQFDIHALARKKGWYIEAAMRAKHEFNKTRPHRHGGKVL